MVDTSLRQHGVVLDLTFTQLWCVGADDDQFCFTLSEGLQRASVAQSVFATLHDESQSGVDAFASFLLDWSHFVVFVVELW